MGINEVSQYAGQAAGLILAGILLICHGNDLQKSGHSLHAQTLKNMPTRLQKLSLWSTRVKEHPHSPWRMPFAPTPSSVILANKSPLRETHPVCMGLSFYIYHSKVHAYNIICNQAYKSDGHMVPTIIAIMQDIDTVFLSLSIKTQQEQVSYLNYFSTPVIF